MNKILLYVALCFSTITFGQSPSFGLRAGILSASIKGEATENFNNLLGFTNGAITTNSKTGFYGGVYATIPLTDVISIEPGVQYSQKGYEIRGELNLKGVEFLGANAKSSLQSQYIDMPVVLKANINGFQVFLGPQVSYLTKAEMKSTAGILGFNLLNNTMDATSKFNEWDAAITGGLGYQFTNGLNVSASYDHGLSKIDANKNMDAYNRSFKVGVGFSF